MRAFLKYLYNRLIPTFLMGVGLVFIWTLAQKLEDPVFNLLMRWSAKPNSKSQVVLVLMDDESVGKLNGLFGPLPWKPEAKREVWNVLSAEDPSVIATATSVLDGVVPPQDHGNAPALVTGIRIERASGEVTLPPRRQGPGKSGLLHLDEEYDGRIKSVYPVFSRRENGEAMTPVPTFALETAVAHLNQTRGGFSWRFTPGAAAGGERPALSLISPRDTRRVPLDALGRMTPRWQAQARDSKQPFFHSHKAIPLWWFFEPDRAHIKALGEHPLRGKIALLGSASRLLRDDHPTPMTLHHLEADIHATAIDNILEGNALFRAKDWQQWMILIGFCVAVCLLRIRLHSFQQTVLYTTGIMMLYFWMAYDQFNQYGRVLDVVTPEAFMGVGLLMGGTIRGLSGERQVRVLERTLSQLVSQSVLREIQRLQHTLEPGGQRREITSMFVDIRNFTAMAENLPAAEVTEILNAFYSAVVPVIFNHRGTVDKFMGDGILIIFGAPIASDNHADMALAAARDVLRATGELSERWRRERGIQSEIGISVNSGFAFVGFLGPANKLEYSAVGDTVNLCVRLQEWNKRFHARLILSEYTVARLSDAGDLSELEEVSVRGRESTLKIFTLGELLPPR